MIGRGRGARIATALTLALTLAVSACSGPAGELRVEDAWVRSNPNLLGAAYLAITARDADTLVAAAVDPSVAGSVELHEVTEQDGMMRMREVDGIALPAGRTVRLEPGGYHIMLLDMPAMLEPGQDVAITLTFASGTTTTVTAEVRASTSPDDTMHDHPGHEQDGQHDERHHEQHREHGS